jgi:hypothetical protein
MRVPRPHRPADDVAPAALITVTRTSPLRWQAWSYGLVNPRYGLTRARAFRRAQSDLDHEWRTGHVARSQRTVRAVGAG